MVDINLQYSFKRKDVILQFQIHTSCNCFNFVGFGRDSTACISCVTGGNFIDLVCSVTIAITLPLNVLLTFEVIGVNDLS